MHGGRGGAKSHTVAQVLLMMSMQRQLRILCVREVQKSLKESSMQVLKDYIGRLGLESYFEVLKTEIRCLTTGSTFSFSGLKDHTADSIKSWEGADIVWVEEAHSVTARSWNILIPTIRKAGSEVWITFNPDQEDDYVYDRFIKQQDQNAWVCEINWRDNPWFGSEMDEERRTLQAINDDLYQHVWEGRCRSVAGLLFKRPWLKRFDLASQPETLNKYIASDYAGGPDPNNPDSDPDYTEHGCAGLDHNGDLWFVDWWSGQEDPDTWIKAWLAMIRRNKPLAAFEEKGVILRAVDASINKAMREADTYVARMPLASAGNKASRALGFAARAAAGTVWVPNTDWGDRLVNQLCAFNGQDGRRDDMVDVCSLLARGLDDMTDARPAAPPKKDPPKPFTRQWFNEVDRLNSPDPEANARYYR
ncbi:PBSX family phage terminase large subunit [Pseudoxanthomonas sp. X-1]|nr:PBSX family phage terminase large subunit [Pseudoxanthomonas sp. X-1]